MFQRLLLVAIVAMQSVAFPSTDFHPLTALAADTEYGLFAELASDTDFFFFEVQAPEHPGVYDSPLDAVDCTKYYSPREVHLVFPDAGIDEDTGLIVVLRGITPAADCSPIPLVLEEWHNTKNVVVATVHHRNLAYRFPSDFGKLGIGDILRGTGHVLENYPVNRKRMYLFGSSGGGHMALQVYQFAPHLWNEVHAHASITKITTAADVENGYSTRWNKNLQFPEVQGSLDDPTWHRFLAERELRSPQFHVANDPILTNTPVWVFHGDSDDLVNFRHLTDFRGILSQKIGVPLEPGNPTVLGNYAFVRIVGGNHSYGGASADENTRTKASAKYAPDCFTSVATAEPALFVDYTSSFSNGYALRAYGALKTVAISVVQAPAGLDDWQNHQ